MSVSNFEELAEHIGHKIVAVSYGNPKEPANVAIECETCKEVLLDFDNEGGEQKEQGGKKMEGLAEQILEDEFGIELDSFSVSQLEKISKLLKQVAKEKKGGE